MTTGVMPTAARELPISPAAWNSIRRFAGADGRHRIARSGCLRTPAGVPVYVVVIAPEAEALPTAAAIRLRYLVTQREAEVALLIARRLSGPEIAAELGLSIHTVRRHTEQVLGKIGVNNRLAVRSELAGLAESAAASGRDLTPGDRGSGGDWQASSAARLRVDSLPAARLAG